MIASPTLCRLQAGRPHVIRRPRPPRVERPKKGALRSEPPHCSRAPFGADLITALPLQGDLAVPRCRLPRLGRPRWFRANTARAGFIRWPLAVPARSTDRRCMRGWHAPLRSPGCRGAIGRGLTAPFAVVEHRLAVEPDPPSDRADAEALRYQSHDDHDLPRPRRLPAFSLASARVIPRLGFRTELGKFHRSVLGRFRPAPKVSVSLFRACRMADGAGIEAPRSTPAARLRRNRWRAMTAARASERACCLSKIRRLNIEMMSNGDRLWRRRHSQGLWRYGYRWSRNLPPAQGGSSGPSQAPMVASAKLV